MLSFTGQNNIVREQFNNKESSQYTKLYKVQSTKCQGKNRESVMKKNGFSL